MTVEFKEGLDIDWMSGAIKLLTRLNGPRMCDGAEPVLAALYDAQEAFKKCRPAPAKRPKQRTGKR